ncbi:malonate decarboxylase acyl carrier protein (plasmid) [Cupriavidus sp. P-10]|uniref:malonate decarboxylase acyl carrier protein n=1 Tax=Cupriavidus sp. P-10 TaxID=2027911 RepID=UPI000E2E9A9D|nr:malonate decarboxylase acyl carrier protein [Cupriavidus sp. P-10]BDB30016.1 malonate decarboxylase acyl carrier protein [Cupriavidus sp. P-10]
MQRLEYEFGPFPPYQSRGTQPTLVGVVGSGNLEALVEAKELGGRMRFVVDTSIAGFDTTWEAVLRDFADRYRKGNLIITVNDAGATPSVVSLRLAQAAEELGL